MVAYRLTYMILCMKSNFFFKEAVCVFLIVCFINKTGVVVKAICR
ncbi:hypothetical protein XBJ2_430031 [Xenorhabdus bovienii str. Jollieti]|uniref:Uncharacterized protein n=1 Tax=Xenorhabdus bovienii (strain SS-2004) TaxID=406818 RepID=D3UZM7_XENBS|nr:hypothetical protein XBJ1_0915 [Xenorhabdus bovienii SS-2004]CDH29770.1 hypothetical protein XBJ2_430031 [Xenorhabdus bovienii str. Jollieti]